MMEFMDPRETFVRFDINRLATVSCIVSSGLCSLEDETDHWVEDEQLGDTCNVS
jgi:hypothetical protein